MIGVAVNGIAVIVGTFIGCLIKKGIPKKISDAAMIAVGASIICIAIPGITEVKNTLAVILSLVLGNVIGTLADIDGHITNLGNFLEKKFSKNSDSKIAQAFISSTLLFCVGAMAVVGPMNAGISNDNSMLFAKSLLDLISATMLAASLGMGVIFSTVSVVVYQGLIAVAASFLAPVLTAEAVNDLTATGSVLILLLSFDMLGISKLKLANFLPALILSPLFSFLFGLF